MEDSERDLSGREIGLDTKVAHLSDPAAYDERPSRVEAKETHMSWVFLTDSHAYKLKKPVRYAFLDFATVALRRHYCEEEVRLNRRLAPDVYLGVVPLAVDRASRLRLGGAGRTVDWLVKMRRLPAERTLEAAIFRNAVAEADIRRLAGRLAAFFRAAEPVDMSAKSYCERLAGGIEGNRRELARDVFGLPGDIIARTGDAQARFVSARRALLEERVRERRIVEGHGDLRPEHVYLGAEPIVTDCIEFNRDFRLLDPADELAYLAMECAHIGAPYVKAWLLDGYAEASGDRPHDDLVRFHESCRAMLRAKLSIWHLADPNERRHEHWRQRSLDYLRLAHERIAGLA